MSINIHLTEEQLQNYFDGFYDVHKAAIIKEHLSQCDECKLELNKLESLREKVKLNYEVPPLSFDLSEKVSAVVFEKRRDPSAFPESFLYSFLLLLCIGGIVYCTSILIRFHSMIMLLALLIPVALYLVVSYQEIKILRSKKTLQQYCKTVKSDYGS